MNVALSQEQASTSGWQAHLALKFEQGLQHRTHMHVQRRMGPLAVQKALYPEGGVCHVMLLHPPGGMVGGDELRLEIGVGNNAHALLTTPGAGKWYRSQGITSRFEQSLEVGEGAILEYLPQEAIVFDGTLGLNRIDIRMKQGARLIGWDIVALGRPASGESFRSGSLSQVLHIEHEGVPLLNERTRYMGGDRLLASPLGLAGHRVVGTLFAAGPRIAESLASVRAVLPASGKTVAATAWDNMLVVRMLGDDTQHVRKTLESAWATLRRHWLGLPAVPPRIWST